jgi:anti-sigma regulatory factor (Ser/Thr protein kinase)
MRETIAAPPPAVTSTRTHRSYLEAAAAPGAVPYARRHTRHMLAAWKLSHLADDAELLVSELLTNAVQATLGIPLTAPVALYLAADHDRLTVLVWDACPQPPVRRPHDDDAVNGRGLEIIEALSDRCGSCVPDHGGKVVWAWLDLPRP